MDNVFLSLIQDFGKKHVKESWVTVKRVLKGSTHHPRDAHPPLPPRDTQFIVVLKGMWLRESLPTARIPIPRALTTAKPHDSENPLRQREFLATARIPGSMHLVYQCSIVLAADL
jgi:hypothetical protein